MSSKLGTLLRSFGRRRKSLHSMFRSHLITFATSGAMCLRRSTKFWSTNCVPRLLIYLVTCREENVHSRLLNLHKLTHLGFPMNSMQAQEHFLLTTPCQLLREKTLISRKFKKLQLNLFMRLSPRSSLIFLLRRHWVGPRRDLTNCAESFSKRWKKCSRRILWRKFWYKKSSRRLPPLRRNRRNWKVETMSIR